MTEPRNKIPLEKRVENLKEAMRQKYSEAKWIIVCNKNGKWLCDMNINEFADKIGVTTRDVHIAINKGIPIKGYLVDYDLA